MTFLSHRAEVPVSLTFPVPTSHCVLGIPKMETVRESRLTPLHDTYALTTMISKMEDLTAVI